MNEQRIAELEREDPSLLRRHAERIAELEHEATLWRRRALTDPVTGLLSERAHLADAPFAHGHAVMLLPDAQAVYDECGQDSGNVFVRDLTDALRPTAAQHDARLYRIGSAKLAAIVKDVQAAERLMVDVKAVLDSLSITCQLPGGRGPDRSVPRTAGLDGFLASQPGTFGATVRAKPGLLPRRDRV